MSQTRPDVIVIMTDQERATPPYESDELGAWRDDTLTGRKWFAEHAVSFGRHYTGSLACVPSRPTLFTGHYPDLHGVTQTDGLGKLHDDSRLRWLPEGEVPTLGNWFRAAGYDTHYDGKWHISHADLVDAATGEILATNDDDGNVDAAAVQRYLAADPLGPYGFSGWVGPEPHGPSLANSGVRRDPLIAARVVAWLEDRYARRAAGDADAKRPFLLVASFVNPHDIVLFPAWIRQGMPIEPGPLDPPAVAPSPTDDEDLSTKPAAQIAYRESYPTGYGPVALVGKSYRDHAQEYRDLYYRLHAEVDAPLDQVRRAITAGHEAGAFDEAVIVRTVDHGELLGAHGGLHQKWFNLYDEATRVPFEVVRLGSNPTEPRVIDDAPTSHVDLVPTLLGAAGIDEAVVAKTLQAEFSEVHPLPGRNLMPVVDGVLAPDRNRAVYVLTRDNMLEGDTGASGFARRIGRTVKPPAPLRIKVPAHVGANFEGIIARVEETDAPGGAGHLWKLVRTFDDPATWTEPGVRHLAANGLRGDEYRTEPLADQWELYDLTTDPIEHVNHWRDDDTRAVFEHMRSVLKHERAHSVPERNVPWPYVRRRASAPATKRVPPPARLLRKGLQRLGLHPDDPDAREFEMLGKRALIVCTNRAVLDVGKATGVFASEMTVPYYAFLDAGMFVDLASPNGGVIPVDPQSVKPVIRSVADDRFLADDELRAKVAHSLAIADVDIASYDIVFLAGGWGAAFDLGTSDALGEKITEANALGTVIGGVCHGPLGLLKATAPDGRPLVEGRRVSAVTDKQVRELGIESTPQHPETELRAAGAHFESVHARRDPLANHWVVDDNLVTGQNQNAGPMVAREMMQILADRKGSDMSDTRAPRYGTVDRDYGMRLATTRPEDDGPVWMVNLMKYREVADYTDGRETAISGREADDLYAPLESLAGVGAEVAFLGEVDQQLLGGAPIWDRVGVVKYPTRRSFIEMQSRPDFQRQHVHKDAGMAETIVIGCQPFEVPEWPAEIELLDWSEVPHPPTADDGPVMVIHVLKYRDAADAAVTPEQMEAYTRSAAVTAGAHGGRVAGWFAAEGTILGDGRTWDQVRFNAFPSKAAFMAVVFDPARLEAQKANREPAIADTYTMIVRPSIDRIADSISDATAER